MIFYFLIIFTFSCDATSDNKPLWQQKECKIYRHVLNVEAEIIGIEDLIFMDPNLVTSSSILQRLNTIRHELSINEL